MATTNDFYTRKGLKIAVRAVDYEAAARDARRNGNDRASEDLALMAATERKAAAREFALALAAGEK